MRYTYIILLAVDFRYFNGRRILENLENVYYPSTDSLKNAYPKNAIIWELSDYMDACNNQEIDLEQFWIGYAHVIKN